MYMSGFFHVRSLNKRFIWLATHVSGVNKALTYSYICQQLAAISVIRHDIFCPIRDIKA